MFFVEAGTVAISDVTIANPLAQGGTGRGREELKLRRGWRRAGVFDNTGAVVTLSGPAVETRQPRAATAAPAAAAAALAAMAAPAAAAAALAAMAAAVS